MNTIEAPERTAARWSALAIGRLLDSTMCPVCEKSSIHEQRCLDCGADFTGSVGAELWDASQTAAAALRSRQKAVDSVPLRPIGESSSDAGSEGEAGKPPASAASVAHLDANPRSSATVQSVLAVAGAGLVAVAAIVFTFFNADLTDVLARNLIIAVITVLFIGGTVALSRRSLQFSAEAVGTLGILFLALDISSVAQASPTTISPWLFAAIGTLIAASAMTLLGARVRIRVWVWSALLALALVPLMFGLAEGSTVGAMLGSLASAGAAFALIEVATRIAPRFDGGLRGERISLTVAQLVFIAAALLLAWRLPLPDPAGFWPVVCAVLVTIAVLSALSAQHPAGQLWSFLAGAAGVGAFTVLPSVVLVSGVVMLSADWYAALNPAAAVVGLIVVAILLPVPRAVRRAALTTGALCVVLAAALAPTFAGLLFGAASVALGGLGDSADPLGTTEGVTAVAVGLAALAAGLIAFARLTPLPGLRWLGALGQWYSVAAVLTLMTSPGIQPWGRIALGLGFALALCAVLTRSSRVRDAAASTRLPLIVGAHIAVFLGALLSWRESALTVGAGIAIILTLAALARTVPRPARFVHVGIGYGYALVIFAFALAQLGVEPVALVCLTTTAGGIGAIAATFIPLVRPQAWYAVLVVTSVPFVIGVVQVVFERSAWTALSTAVIFALALTLVFTKRPGLGVLVRSLAAAVLVPSLAVVAVCLGAQLLVSSGSPVVLPVIAAIIAITLPTLAVVQQNLQPRIGERDAAAARLAIEASALLTATITVLLSLARDAAGLPTTLLVLIILGVGFVATALCAARGYGWWLAGAASTGALWCAWGIAGVGIVEPYLLPPTLGAALVAIVLTARGVNARVLYAAGLGAAVVPLFVLLALDGPLDSASGAVGDMPWRAYGLVAASWVLVLGGRWVGRSTGLSALAVPTLAIALVAGAAGAVQGARWGLGLDDSRTPAVQLIVLCAAIGVAGALPAARAGYALRASMGSTSLGARWVYAPAAVYVAVAMWPAITRDWFTIWTMWALMLGYLGVMVVAAARGVRLGTSLPPVWFLFGLAFVTAIVAWSPRDLRVEWFSLPLGLFLLASGVIAMRRGSASIGRSLHTWPAGFTGSWWLLAPGMVVMLSASIAATYTDPLTWRAILVIVLALVAILIGSSAKLAAPFLIGIVVLPVENALAFMVQIGRGIQSMPWWITLAVVGAVLLIIAVTYERRAGEGTGIAARIRDLA